MSPPIRDGSGNSIGSIRLGDGSEIAEVRTGAGDVLFSGSTIPDSGIDNFEEVLYEDKNNSLTDYYGGNTGSFTRDQTSPVFGGSYSLKVASNNAHITSVSGLPAYPEQGDTFEYRVNFAGSSDTSTNLTVDWANQAESGSFPNNMYYVGFANQFSDINLIKISGGSQSELDSVTGVNPNTAEWIRIEVDWQNDGSMDVVVENEDGTQIASLSGQDTEYTSGGVGYGSSDDNGNNLAIDEVKIL